LKTISNVFSLIFQNYTAKVCGCVKFSVIRDKKTPICTAEENECFENAENELFNGEITLDGKSNQNRNQALMKCQCLSQCESLKYELELVKTNYKSELVLKGGSCTEVLRTTHKAF